MNKAKADQLENLKRHIEWLDAAAYQRQVEKTKDPQAVFDLIRRGDTTGVACALREGLSSDLIDSNGMTPLHHAAGHDTKLITSLLIEKVSAAPWIRDRYGRLPLDVAREAGHQEIGNRLERVTYPGLFRNEIDGPASPELIQRYEVERSKLRSADTRPPYAQELEPRGHLPKLKSMDRDDRTR